MKTIYIDPNTFKCYVENDGTRIAVETDAFNGKCDAYIEATRFVPYGETWTREDGVVFHGEMSTPWKDANERENAQREYERQLLKELQENSIPAADLENAYREGVDSVYD